MAIMTSLYTGVSGLSANGRALSVIGDNIANVNTTGFKGSRAIFGDILSQALGGGGALQIGRGVMLMGVQQIFTQGTLETTANPLDLAIEGDGFFIARDAAGAQFYTRAGQFRLDRKGDIVNPEGLKLQGYLALQGGILGTINVAALNSPPQRTANVTMHANLNSATPVNDPTTMRVFAITSANNTIRIGGTDYTIRPGNYTGAELATELNRMTPATPPTGLTFAYIPADHRFEIRNAGAAVTINWDHTATTAEQILGFRSVPQTIAAGTAALPTTVRGVYDAVGFDPINAIATSDEPRPSITVFDSLGNSHLINIHFRKTGENITGPGTGNRWHWYAVIPPASSLTGQAQVGAQGFLEFDTAGRLVTDIPEYRYFYFAGGVTAPQEISFDFGRSITEGGSGLLGTTQFGSPAAVLFQSQDGFTAGSLMSLIVDQNGAMTGIFTNGQTRKVADVALARFIAPTVLTKLGRNLFAESAESGSPIIGTAGTAGRGRIFANSLEASNIDLADEFVKMIAAQRGFQANTRVITTADDLLTELMMIRR
jgi:flagellar hook protein FlgE